MGEVLLAGRLVPERTMGDQDDIDGACADDPVDRRRDVRGQCEISNDCRHPRFAATRAQIGRNALEPFGIPSEQGEILRLPLRPEPRAMRGHRRGRANDHDSLCVLHFMLQEVFATSPN